MWRRWGRWRHIFDALCRVLSSFHISCTDKSSIEIVLKGIVNKKRHWLSYSLCAEQADSLALIYIRADSWFTPNHRPHSRQVTEARCTGGRGSPVMSWILVKANNAQQAWGVGDRRFFRFKRNVQLLWTAIIRHHVNDITYQQVMRFNQW